MSVELIGWLRGRAKQLHGYDKVKLHEAADALELGGAEYTAESVVAWLAERDVSLVPWQKKRLGVG